MFGINPCLFTARYGTLAYLVVVPITLALTSNLNLDLIPPNSVKDSNGGIPRIPRPLFYY